MYCCMKKIIIVATNVLLFIILLIILVLNTFRNKIATQQSNQSLFPTLAPHNNINTKNNSTNSSKKGGQNKQTNTQNSSTDINTSSTTNTNNFSSQHSSPISQSLQKTMDDLYLPSNPALISQKDKENLAIITQIVPINNDDFSITYSSILNKYIVTIKNDKGEEAFTAWANQNGILSTLQNNNIAIISRATITEVHSQIAPTIQPKEKTQENIPEDDSQKAQKQIGLFLNLFNIFFSLPESINTDMDLNMPTPTSILLAEPAIGTPGAPYSGTTNTGNLLPNPLPPISTNALKFKASVQACLANQSVYEIASSQTGVPWEILTAIHYNEGSCGQDKSLISGRIIGTNEPDIVRGGGCSSGRSGPGIPIPLTSGGCGFNTLLDSAIYAGNHIKGKIGKIPSNFQELAKAFSRYSGGGNSNCGSTPYPYCPELFEGEDDAYVINMFDQKHETMYLVYCADLAKCNPPRKHLRPGVATIIRLVTNQL